MSEIVAIHTFDDGRKDFKKYINRWIITKKMFHGSIPAIGLHIIFTTLKTFI